MTSTARESQKIGLSSLEGVRQDPTNLNSIETLHKRLNRSREARAQFVSSQIDKGIPYQLRAIRDRQGLSQEEFAKAVGMNQNAISRLESPRYGRATIGTLKRLAAAFDVALAVRFVPFSHLVNWVSGTPFVEYGLSTESLAVPSFEEEMERAGLNINKKEQPFELSPLLRAVSSAQKVTRIDVLRDGLEPRKRQVENDNAARTSRQSAVGEIAYEAISGNPG
jgi:transcriptional regulator with XRE-family HTH domain